MPSANIKCYGLFISKIVIPYGDDFNEAKISSTTDFTVTIYKNDKDFSSLTNLPKFSSISLTINRI